MFARTQIVVGALAASLGLAACGSSAGSGSTASSTTVSSATASAAASPAAVVRTAAEPSLGHSVLVDARGMTLYRLSGEQNGKFICASAACVSVWHPLVASGTPTGVAALGTVKRPDGTEQVTYRGMPLYTFAQDAQPGDAKGEGLKDVGTWNAVSSSAGSGPAAAPATSSTSSTRAYGY